jgi:hypothetical protein
MTEATSTSPGKTRWHVWLVGVAALLWNGFGAFDYVMTESRNAAYLSAFTPEQIAYFDAFPAWVVAAWALGVWGGVFGAILLLLRWRLAVPVFGVSLVAMVVTFFHNYVLSDGLAMMGGAAGLAFSTLIMLVGVLLLIYARLMLRKRVLS